MGVPGRSIEVVPGSRPSVYPVGLLLEGRPCLVVGGGPLARARTDGLLRTGAEVTVVAERLDAEFSTMAVEHWPRRFRPGDVAGFRVVLAASGDRALDEEVFADGERHGVLVNAADHPDACAFYLPALLERGPLSVAISSSGASPAVAAWARDRIASVLPDAVGELVDLIGATRDDLRARGYSSEGRPWRTLIESVLEALEGHDPVLAASRAEEWLDAELARSGPVPGDE